MNDDELGEFLRGEVPEPGAGYWEAIDARLADAAAPADGSEKAAGSMQTDAEVVRLTDMTKNTPSRSRAPMPRLLAAAAALVVLGGLAVVLLREGDPAPEVVADDPDPVDEVAGTTVPADPDPTVDRICFGPLPTADLVVVDLAPDGGFTGAYLRFGGTIRGSINGVPSGDQHTVSYVEVPDAGEPTSGVGGWRLGDDAATVHWPSSEVPILACGDADVDELLATAPDLPPPPITLFDAVLPTGDGSGSLESLDVSPAAIWIPAGDQPVALWSNFATAEGVRPVQVGWVDVDASIRSAASGQGVVSDGLEWRAFEALPDSASFPWAPATELVRVAELSFGPDVISTWNTIDATVTSRRWPADDAPGVPVGTFNPVSTTTTTATTPDGVVWREVAGGDGGWIRADELTATDAQAAFDPRSCYADDESVLVLDFAADAETFVGGFAFLDSVESVEGVRDETAGSVFDVESTAIGSAEETGEPVVLSERWLATADGLSIGERAFLEPVSCDTVSFEVERLVGLLGLDG